MIAVTLVDGDRTSDVITGTQEWRATLKWARFHGLDPMRIPAGSTVLRDAAARCIYYTEFVKTGPDRAEILIENGEPVLVDCVEQGEGPPLPFPAGVI